MTRRIRLRPLLLVFAMMLGGCVYRGGLDSPIERKLGWFSYLGADDIRASCSSGSPDRYRLVYNADYERQVRAYDVTADGVGGAILTARVSRPVDLSAVSPADLLGAWRWPRAAVQVSPEDFDALRASLVESGFADGAPDGLTLHSGDTWWLAAGCLHGVYHFAAWVFPGDGFIRLRFPPALLAFDGTGVPVAPPRRALGDPRQERGRAEERSEQRFTLTVRDGGLGRLVPPL